MSALWFLIATVLLGCVLVCSVPAPRDRELTEPHDWREDWCCPECYAAHDQAEPCEDCPARRAERRDQSRF